MVSKIRSTSWKMGMQPRRRGLGSGRGSGGFGPKTRTGGGYFGGQYDYGSLMRQNQQQRAAAAGTAALSGAVGQHNVAFGQARTANEQRYQQMLRIADQDYAQQGAGYQRMLATIGQETGQRAADIRSETEQQVSDYRQQQARLGLSNVYQPSIAGGIRREGQSNLNRLTDALLGRKLGVQQQIAERGRGTRLGIMERRTDEYPQSDIITMLAQQLGGVPGVDYGALGRMRV